jgi:uncharacterized protein
LRDLAENQAFVMFQRWEEASWQEKLATPYVQLVFGARQTGKSTLVRELVPRPALQLDFSSPGQRSEFLSQPDQLIGICRAMPVTAEPPVIVIDEAQNVPAIFDAVQHLYDSDKTRWRFVLCGSSARRLRLLRTNLLPGRSMVSHLYPLTTAERPCLESQGLNFTPQSTLPWPRVPSPLNLPLWPA